MIERNKRQSGVELLKIFGILLVVVNHVTQSLESLKFVDGVIELGHSTTDIQILILNILRQAGGVGNDIFFVCSAWFLVEKIEKTSQKAFELLCTVWWVSVIFLCGYYLYCPTEITSQLLIKSILPNCFCNNWYISCYILFLLIYPAINKYITTINKKEHFRAVILTSSLWIVGNYFKGDCFFSSKLLLWISIYFLMAYLKIYCQSIMTNYKTGFGLLAIGMLGSILQVVVTNYVGLFLIGTLSDKILRWNTDNSPFFLMIAIGGLIISLQANWKSKLVNYLSKLSVLVYLIHENILFRTFSRPAIWSEIIDRWGTSYIVFSDLMFSLGLFAISLIVAFIYRETIQRVVIRVSHFLYLKISKLINCIEHKLHI